MKENLYDLMDWSDIEGIQYADLDCPRCTLGPSVYKGKTLIQLYVPEAVSVSVKFEKGRRYIRQKRWTMDFLRYWFLVRIMEDIR